MSMAAAARAENISDWVDIANSVTDAVNRVPPGLCGDDMHPNGVSLPHLPACSGAALHAVNYSPTSAVDSHFLFPPGEMTIPGGREPYGIIDFSTGVTFDIEVLDNMMTDSI